MRALCVDTEGNVMEANLAVGEANPRAELRLPLDRRDSKVIYKGHAQKATQVAVFVLRYLYGGPGPGFALYVLDRVVTIRDDGDGESSAT